MKTDNFESIPLDSSTTFSKSLYSSAETMMNTVSIIDKLTTFGREATLLPIEKLSLSPDCVNGMLSCPKELLEEIEQHSLTNFYETKLNNKNSFFSKVSNEELMNYNDELVNLACHLFKLLCSYLGDRESVKRPLDMVKTAIKLSLNSVEDLKDEVYVQALKQLTNNPSETSTHRAWNYLAILASCYAPSAELYYCILNWLADNIKNSENKELIKKSNYIFKRLYKSFEQKRKQVPTDNEIIHIECMKSIMFPIWFFNEGSTSVPTESYTNVQELKTTVMKKLELSIAKIPYFCLYEICDKDDVIEERFISDSFKIVDIIAIWDKECSYYKTKLQQNLKFKLYLKIQLFYAYPDNDNETITLMYVQLLHDIYYGKYTIKEQDIAILASLRLYIDSKESDNHVLTNKYLSENLSKLVPVSNFEDCSTLQWEHMIMQLYTNLKIESKMQAKLSYIAHLKSFDLYEAHQFFVKWSHKFNMNNNPENFPDNIILGLKPKSILICDSERNTLKEVEYINIASWGINHEIFVMVIRKSTDEITKYYFESSQTNIFQYLIEAYTNIMVGKSITEIHNNISSSISRVESQVNSSKKENQFTQRSRNSSSFKKNKNK